MTLIEGAPRGPWTTIAPDVTTIWFNGRGSWVDVAVGAAGCEEIVLANLTPPTGTIDLSAFHARGRVAFRYGFGGVQRDAAHADRTTRP